MTIAGFFSLVVSLTNSWKNNENNHRSKNNMAKFQKISILPPQVGVDLEFPGG